MEPPSRSRRRSLPSRSPSAEPLRRRRRHARDHDGSDNNDYELYLRSLSDYELATTNNRDYEREIHRREQLPPLNNAQFRPNDGRVYAYGEEYEHDYLERFDTRRSSDGGRRSSASPGRHPRSCSPLLLRTRTLPGPRKTLPHDIFLQFANNPREFGTSVRTSLATGPDPRIALPDIESKRFEERRLKLQQRHTAASSRAPPVHSDVIYYLFEDTITLATDYYRECATVASNQGAHHVARLRLAQSKALAEASECIKTTAGLVAGDDCGIRTIYLRWATSGILGYADGSEVNRIIKEAHASLFSTPTGHPTSAHRLLPSPQTLFHSPRQDTGRDVVATYGYVGGVRDSVTITRPPAYAPPPALPIATSAPPIYAPAPPPAPEPPTPAPAPPPAANPAPSRGRGIGKVIPSCVAVVGANVPGAMNSSGRVCYLCNQASHLAFSCYMSAAVRLGEPFPGWTADGRKIPELWINNTDISPQCARLWVSFLQRHQISGNPDPTNLQPLPNFAAVAAAP